MFSKDDAKALCLLREAAWAQLKSRAKDYYANGGTPPRVYMDDLTPENWAHIVGAIDIRREELSGRLEMLRKAAARKRKAVYMRDYMRQYRTSRDTISENHDGRDHDRAAQAIHEPPD